MPDFTLYDWLAEVAQTVISLGALWVILVMTREPDHRHLIEMPLWLRWTLVILFVLGGSWLRVVIQRRRAARRRTVSGTG